MKRKRPRYVETKGLLSEVRLDIQDLLYDMERHNTAVPGNRAVTQALLDALVASEADDADGVRDAIDLAAQEAEDGGLSAGFVDAIRAALANVPPEGMDERSAGAVETKGEWNDPVYLALMALAEEHNGIDTGMGYQGATVFQFDDEEDAEAFMDAPSIDDLAAGLKGPERNTERGARPWWTVRVTWAEPSDDDGASDPRGTYLESAPAVETKRRAIAYLIRVMIDDNVSDDTLAAIWDAAQELGLGTGRIDSRGQVYIADDDYDLVTQFVEAVEGLPGVNDVKYPSGPGKQPDWLGEESMPRRALATKASDADWEGLIDSLSRLRGYSTREDLGADPDWDLDEALALVDDAIEAARAEDVDGTYEALRAAQDAAYEGGMTDCEWVSIAEDFVPRNGEKSMSKRATRAKYCDYPSYAGMPFGSPTLSTRYQDIPAGECAELSYSVREAGEALEAASEIYLQRAAAAARGERDSDDSAPDVAAMNTLNGVAVQLESLADRLLAVSEGSSQYLSTGPDAPAKFYSWPDCLPSCLAAVEGALGSVTGDAEYLEVAAQLTVVRDMLRGLLEECDEEEEESEEEIGEMKADRGARTKGRLGRLSAVSDKVDYAVDALAGFSRGTPGVTDALRILKDMQAAIEDGDRDAFHEALVELGDVRDEVDGDLDEGETGEFPHELAWLLSDLTDAYYGNKAARGVRTKGGSTEQDIYDGWSDVVDATTGLDASVTQEIIGKLQDLVDAEPMDVQAVSDAIADAVLNAGEYEDAEALVSALERFDRIVSTFEITKGHSMRDTRTKKASRRSRFGDERSAMDTLAELSAQLDRVTDEAWTGRRRIVDSKARAALETAVAAASFVAESVGESVDAKAPLPADQLAEELSRAGDALRVLEKSGDPWAATFRDDLSEFGSLLGRSASALDRYLDEKGEASGDEDDSDAGGRDESRGSRGEKLRRRQLAARERAEAEIVRKANRAARLAREVQGLEQLISSDPNDRAFERAVTAPASELAAKRAARVRAY